jgi:lysophospholipase L1-like esterase
LAYDDYRQHLRTLSRENGWNYLDLWDAVDNHQFTNSAIHMTPEGTRQFARLLIESIIEIARSSAPALEN